MLTGPTKERRGPQGRGSRRGDPAPQGGASRLCWDLSISGQRLHGTGTYTSEEWTLLAFGGGPLDAQRVPTELGLTRLQNRHLQAVLVPSEPRYLPETSWGPWREGAAQLATGISGAKWDLTEPGLWAGAPAAAAGVSEGSWWAWSWASGKSPQKLEPTVATGSNCHCGVRGRCWVTLRGCGREQGLPASSSLPATSPFLLTEIQPAWQWRNSSTDFGPSVSRVWVGGPPPEGRGTWPSESSGLNPGCWGPHLLSELGWKEPLSFLLCKALPSLSSCKLGTHSKILQGGSNSLTGTQPSQRTVWRVLMPRPGWVLRCGAVFLVAGGTSACLSVLILSVWPWACFCTDNLNMILLLVSFY